MSRVRSIRRTILFLLMLCMLFTLSGCGSVDKDDAFLSIKQTDFEYHEETDITTIYCKVAVQNDTIYNISSFEVNLGVYCNGESVEMEPLSYKHRIKHGELDTLTLTFTAQGEADLVALSSWTPHFESIWKTHLNTIIILIAVAVIGVVIWIKETFF